MSIIVDFYKKTGHLPCHHHFADNDFIKSGFKVPPEKALEWLKKRGDKLKLTVNWDDLNSDAHNKSFTVAKVLTADLLQNFYNLVEKAKGEGWSLEKFQEEALPYAEQTGWTGNKLHRLRIIYNTNMMTAYAKGKYQQQSLLAKNGLYPYLEYLPSSSEEPNPLHKKFYGLVLKFDDPFWNSFYPPSRFGCQCSTRSVSQKEIDDRKLNIVNGNDLIQSILKDPQLSKYYELENKSKLNVLKAWKPATNVYVNGIKTQLEKLLANNPNQINLNTQKISDKDFKDLTEKIKLNSIISYDYNEFLKDRTEYYKQLNNKTVDALDEYMGSGHEQINQDTLNNVVNNYFDEIVKNDMSYTLPVNKDGKDDIVVYRGESYKDETKYKNRIKSIFDNKTYTLFSTSCNIEKAFGFSKIKYNSYYSILFTMKLNKGTKVGIGTDYEFEFILNKDVKYKINKVEEFEVEGIMKCLIEIELI